MKRALLFCALFLASTILYAHGGLRDLKGTIAKISPESIVVTHTDGKTNETGGTFHDMRVGSRVVVHFGHDGKGMEVHLPQKPAS
jgi:hypothetical protein